MTGVLLIRPEQLMLLQAVEAKKADGRLLERLRRRLPELAHGRGQPDRVAELWVETKRRAPEYELETELDLFRFALLLARYGLDFDRDERRPFIGSILRDRRFDGTTRMDRLLARLEQEASEADDVRR